MVAVGNMEDLRVRLRRERAVLVNQTWQCQCGSALAPDDLWQCGPCVEREARERDAEELARRCREALRRRLSGRDQAVRQLPRWVRTTPPQTALDCLHPRLRQALERYRLGDRSLLIVGPSGAGKTTWCALVVLAYAAWSTSEDSDPLSDDGNRLAQFAWTTGHALVRARREHGLGDGDAPLIAQAMRASVLVVDELGAEPASEVPFEVVDWRYASGLPTLITSGLTSTGFRERYGDALWRRLTENGIGACIDLHGGERGR